MEVNLCMLSCYFGNRKPVADKELSMLSHVSKPFT